jgi:hypothetical protein
MPASYYDKYMYRALSDMNINTDNLLPPPAVIHFVGAHIKPWVVLMFEFVDMKKIKF